MIVPTGTAAISYLDAMIGLKRHYGLTLVGLSGPNDRSVDLNCPTDRNIRSGDQLFYIADERMSPENVLWASITDDQLPAVRADEGDS